MKGLGKIMKWILLGGAALIGIIIAGAILLLLFAGYKNENYWKYTDAKGEIEKEYAALGSYEVEYAEFDAESDVWQKYEVFYPSNIETSDEKYPMVIMANGTGIKASQYEAVLKHLASWGFIVVGNEDENSRTGASSAATLDFMLAQNEDENSVFYGHIDTDNIGIAGHSQGGVGAINAVTNQENGRYYKTIFSISATSRFHANELNKSGDGWNIEPSKINIPCAMIAGTGLFDAGNIYQYQEVLAEGEAQGICPLWWLEECYHAIPNNNTKVIARQKSKDHGDMLRSADGYMTAWFMYWLQGDEEAGKAFFGENAEIKTNENWKEVQTNGQ
ncbi:MAG: alpha/beta hydrolase [Agathobacter sp.]|nr:alpha/beta hydrolase [Agathobacter sp.]